MAILSKDQIWAADDIEERTIEVPKWGGEVRVRSLSLEQVAEINTQAEKRAKGNADVAARLRMAGLLCEGIIEPEYDFNEAQRLMKKSAAATSIVVQAINELSGLLPEAVAEADKSTDGESQPSLSVRLSTRAWDDPAAVGARDASA